MPPPPTQIRDALTSNFVRVVDLFREWDDDGSGSVSRTEFAKAMAQLGYEGSAEDVDLVFDSMDPDGSGSLAYKELQELLKRSCEINPALKPGAAGEIVLEKKNKVALRKAKLDENDSCLLQGLDIDEASDKSVAEQARLGCTWLSRWVIERALSYLQFHAGSDTLRCAS